MDKTMNEIEEIKKRHAAATAIKGVPVQLQEFGGSKFVSDGKRIVLEVLWGSFSDQEFYANVYQDVKILLERIEELEKNS
jgi:hypothetical protein